ncbi:MAG TPA: hypothetical protein VN794_07630, partial [Methylomirabilota bacterium]|nr:hypothetical protein [Methylomirabilota bacterium]
QGHRRQCTQNLSFHNVSIHAYNLRGEAHFEMGWRPQEGLEKTAGEEKFEIRKRKPTKAMTNDE